MSKVASPPSMSTTSESAHAEHRIGVEVLAPGVEDVGGDRLVAGGRHHEVDVGRAPRVPSGGAQHLADRTVVGDRVVDRAHGAEPVAALRRRSEQAPQVHALLPVVLDVVEAVRAHLPHVERGAGDRLAVEVRDRAPHDERLTVVVDDDRARRVLRRSPVDVERAEHRRLGGAVGCVVVDHLDQHRHAERVGEEDELLAHVVALLPDAVRNWMPANHSSRVRPTSSTKAWRCLTAAFMISRSAGRQNRRTWPGPAARCSAGVMFRSRTASLDVLDDDGDALADADAHRRQARSGRPCGAGGGRAW